MKNEVVAERLDTLIKQNKEDHNEIICHQEITNGKVILNTKWRYSFISAGIVVTGAVEFVQSLPDFEAIRIVNNFEDEQWEIYKNNK